MPPPNPPPDEAHQELLDSLDIAPLPRSFRKSTWKPPQRRNKNVKQILTEASRKEQPSVLATPQENSGASTPHPLGSTTNGLADVSSDGPSQHAKIAQNLSTLVLERNLLKQNITSGPSATYTNIESAPSLHPAHQKHYCDITGLPAPYTDPKTRLRYHNKEVFGVVRGLGQGVAEKYLEVRGAHSVLK
ncbi:MAG: hypothetical protein M1823_000504 [Watsoniomyces obsoletus]|nr:MAG: hypothetical protein M1823_000504 [Watsoniomyces obsoletus]